MAQGDIVIRNLPQVGQTPNTPLIGDAGISQVASAQQGLARSVGQVGDAAFQFAMRKQRINDAAADSDVLLGLTKTNEEIDTNLQSPDYRNSHEKWVEMGTAAWDKRQQEVERVITENRVSDAAAKQIRQRYAISRERSIGGLTQRSLARDYELKATSITMAAEELYRNELPEAGDRKIDELGLPEAEASALKAKLKNGADYQVAEQDLNFASIPADYDDFMTRLMAKSGEGDAARFDNYPGLDPNQRRNLLKYAQSRKNRVEREGAVALRELNRKLANGTVTNDDVEVARAKGVAPDVIDKIQGAMAAKGTYEENTQQFRELKKELTTEWYRKAFNWDMKPERRMEQLNTISEAKFTPATTAKLVDIWLDGYYQDAIDDGELMIPGIKGKVDLGPQEKQFVGEMFDLYREANAAGDWAPEVLGGLASDQLRDLFTWLETVPDITDDVWKAKLLEYRSGVMGAVAQEQARISVEDGDMFGF